MMQIGVSPKIEYLRVLHVLLEGVVHIQQSQMVSVYVGEAKFAIV